MTKLPVLLFAAGLGTRMGPLTKDRPKPLVIVAGRPLIDHAFDLLDTRSTGPIVVNVHYKAEMIRDHLASRNVLISDETNGLLETGGGLRHALPLLGKSKVATLNTDVVWAGPNPIRALLAAWKPHMEALLVTIPLARAMGHKGNGDFIADQNGRLSRGAGEIYSGLQIVRTDDLADIDATAFSMNVLWDRIAARGGLYGLSYHGHWCDVGQPQSIRLAENMLESPNV
uniref:nucleotidyltransferase family protein n=1 Tax=Yoonia sp. TaxID=2212373 RepID=UPI004048C69C|tara:strand:+ start:303 stop:986 length:684 start_codon:yes stop_codon:yes gene_type:complete